MAVKGKSNRKEALTAVRFAKPLSDGAATPLLPTKNTAISSYSAITTRANTSEAINSDSSLITSSEATGYFQIALSAIFLGSGANVVRYVQTNTSFTSAQITYLLSFNLSVLALSYLLIFTPSPRTLFTSLTRYDIMRLVLRGFVGAGCTYTLIIAFKLLPPGDVLAIFYINPVFAIFLSAIFLHERFTLKALIAAIIAFSGAVLVTHGNNNDVTTSVLKANTSAMGYIAAFTGAFFGAFVPITVRALVTRVHFMFSSLSLGVLGGLLGCIVGGFITPWDFFNRNLNEIFFGSLPGIFVFLGQFFMALGFRNVKAGPGAVVRNLEVIFAYVVQISILREVPDAWRIVGAALVLSSTGILALEKMGV